VEYTPKMLCSSTFYDGCGKVWKGNSSFGILDRIEVSAVDKWKRVLTKKEIDVLNFCCFHELRLMNYEVKKSSLYSLFDYEENNIVEWIKPFDFLWNEKRVSYEISRNFVIENHDMFLSSEFVSDQFLSPEVLRELAESGG